MRATGITPLQPLPDAAVDRLAAAADAAAGEAASEPQDPAAGCWRDRDNPLDRLSRCGDAEPGDDVLGRTRPDRCLEERDTGSKCRVRRIQPGDARGTVHGR